MSRAPVVPDRVFTAGIPLRWADLDSLGHVNNVIFLRLLEEARIRFISALAPLDTAHPGVLAARHEIDYLQQLRYSAEPVEIKMWIERIGTSSFTVAYVVLDPRGSVVCAAKTVIVTIDSSTGQSVPVPDPVRERLAGYLA